MLTKGFEWTYMYGEPRNADTKRYRIQPPCCKIRWGAAGGRQQFVCATPWQPKYELPIGDPVTGREWTKARPDTGTYQGGTFPDVDTP
eukprot:361363-Chlamydomonas_euryale.AAC.2